MPQTTTHLPDGPAPSLRAHKFGRAASLEDLDVQRLVRYELLQPRVLLLRVPQLPCHLRAHPAILRPPPVVGLLAYPHLLAHIGYLQALGEFHVRLTQLGHDLLCT